MKSQKINIKTPSMIDYKQSLDFIGSSKRALHRRLVEQYSTSQGYFYTKTINNLIQSKHCNKVEKQGDVNCINANDAKFDDSKQHLQKYYIANQCCIQVPELLEYYKYYSQDSICFLNRQFAFLASHHDKKKAVLYQKLKKQLNLSDSQPTLGQVTNYKSQRKFQNILSGLQLTNINNDQSYFVADVLKKLVNHFGPSRIKTINKIDSQFKFMAHNLTIGKSKNLGKQGPSLMTHHNMLQSTNTSVRNNCYVKQRKSTSKNNGTHRRFGSCEVPKSTNFKLTGTLNPNPQDKKNRIRRRKSTQLLSYIDLNTVSQQTYKKNSVKTQEEIKLSKPITSQVNFRQKMQQLRKKIRQQKQNLNRKPQSACLNKKKVKK